MNKICEYIEYDLKVKIDDFYSNYEEVKKQSYVYEKNEGNNKKIEIKDELIPRCNGNRFGYVNSKYQLCIPYIFQNAGKFSEGLASVCMCNKWGYIDKDSNVVIGYKYDFATDFEYGLARVLWGNRWGCINDSGKVVVPFKYDSIFPFFNGLAVVEKENRYGVIDTRGVEVIPCKYDKMANSYSYGYIAINKNKKWGYADMRGTVILKPIYDEAEDFNVGFAKVKKNGHYGVVNNTLSETIPCIYDNIIMSSIENGVIIAEKDKKCGLLNNKGEVVVPFIYDDIERFSNEMAVVCKDNQCGYIDLTGNEIIPCIYDNASSFHNGVAIVSKNNKYACINKFNNILPITVNCKIYAENQEDFEEQFVKEFSKYENKIESIKSKYVSVLNTNNELVFIEAGNLESLAIKKIKFKEELKKNTHRRLKEQLEMVDESTLNNLEESYQKKLGGIR